MNAEFFRDLLSGSRNGGTFTREGTFVEPQGDVVTLVCKTVSGNDLTLEEFAEVAEAFFAPYYLSARLLFGFYRMDNGDISIDVNVNVPRIHRANTLAFARANGQESIYDGHEGKVIPCGGDGVALLSTDPETVAGVACMLARGHFPY
jgi:hypothetical protein